MTETQKMRSLLKEIAFSVWVLVALIAGSFMAPHRASFWQGAGFLLIALAVPAMFSRIVERLGGFRAWWQRRHQQDEAVSPVIGVILMVAITVVLSAMIYVYVGGFSQQPAVPGALALAGAGNDGTNWSWTVTSASGLEWDGVRVSYSEDLPYGDSAGEWCVRSNGTCIEPASREVRAGDALRLHEITPGGTLRIVDAEANAVLVALRVS